MDFLRIICVFLRNRQHTYLFRAQPCGEQTCVFLNEPCQGSLIAANGSPVDDAGTFLVAVFVNVVHIKLFSQKGIPLNGDHGVFFAVYVLGIDIHFWSVEGSFSHILDKRNVQLDEDIPDILLGLIPYFRLSDVFFFVLRIPFRKMIGNVLLKSQCFQTVFCQCQTVFKFLHHLVRTDDQVSLGNGKLTHTCQSVHFSGILISE